MLSLFTRSRPSSTRSTLRRARPSLEALESRYCLTGPSLTLSAQALAGHMVQLTGNVTDSHPAGVGVSFSGAVVGSTMTDAYGNYSYSTANGSLGQVNAVAVDYQGLTSSSVSSNVSVAAPILSMSLAWATGGQVTLSGTVTDLDPGGRTVTFTGVLNCTTVTKADGTFSLTTSTQGKGNIQATTTDLWAEMSNTAQVSVYPSLPGISDFGATGGPLRFWTFEGKVTAQEPEGMTVVLGGLPSLKGVTTTVRSDGTFIETVKLAINESGNAWARTTDWWQQESMAATFYVTNY